MGEKEGRVRDERHMRIGRGKETKGKRQNDGDLGGETERRNRGGKRGRQRAETESRDRVRE
jgi:hypothetical protein